MKQQATRRALTLFAVAAGTAAVAVWAIPHPGWATPETAILSAGRVAVVALSLYVAAVVGLLMMASATNSRVLRRLIDAITIGVLRHLIAATLLLSPATPLVAVAATHPADRADQPTAGLPHETVGLPVFDRPVPTTHRAVRQMETQPSPVAPSTPRPGRRPHPARTEPAKDQPAPDRRPSSPESSPTQTTIRYVVESGDNLWDIASAVMTRHRGEAPSDHDHATYWARVCSEVSSQLRSGDPDLIYPGETLELPAP